MFIYYSSVLICFIATFFKDKKIKLFILVGLMIFLCAGYMCGTDWRSYEFAYNHSSLSTVNQEIFEIGYSYLQAICHTLGINFWIFHIALKSIVFFSLCYFVKVFKQNLFLFWFLFLPDMGFYLFIDCPFRNLLAAGGFFLAINLFLKRKFIIFFFITILLAQVHSSAYFLIIIYLFSNLRAKNRYIILFFILSNILAYRLDLITDYILFPLLGIDGYLGERVRTYFIQDEVWNSSVNLGTIYRIICFIIVLYNRKQIESSSVYGRYIFNLAILFFMIYPFGMSMKMIQRFLFYTMPFIGVLLSQFTYDMSSIFNQAMKVVLACLAISCMGYIVTHITWNKRIDDVVQCFGRESLSIYVTHNGPFAFMLFLKDVLPLSDANNLYSIFLFLLISLFISWIAVGIKKVLSLSSVLSFLLYGKKLYLKENKK